MPFHNIAQFVGTTLPTAALMNQIRDNLRYLKGLDGEVTVEDALAVQGLFSADSMRFPRLSTTQRNALTQQNGLAIYNTSDDEFQMRVDGTWENMTAAAPVNEGYTPANAALQGTLPSGVTAECVAWDGQQLVIGSQATDRLYTLARNADGSYTPANAANQGLFFNPVGLTWDGGQMVIIQSNRDLFTLARNADGSYTPTDGVAQGRIGLGGATALAWDGQGLVLGDNPNSIWRLPLDIDGGYTPSNLTDEQTVSGATGIKGLAWDTVRLVIAEGARELLLLNRDNDGGYTGANASSEGSLPTAYNNHGGMTWDGQQLVFVSRTDRELRTLAPDFA